MLYTDFITNNVQLTNTEIATIMGALIDANDNWSTAETSDGHQPLKMARDLLIRLSKEFPEVWKMIGEEI